MVSPCRTCAHRARSKNHPDCVNCPERQAAFDGFVRLEAPVEKMTNATKICSDPDCPHKGEPQPNENFQRNHRMPDGRLNTCKACMGRKIRADHQKRKEKLQADVILQKTEDPRRGFKSRSEVVRENEKLAALYVQDPPPAKPINYHSFEVDFSGHPKLIEKLKQFAEEEMRTLDNQIVYMLKKAIEYKWPQGNPWA